MENLILLQKNYEKSAKLKKRILYLRKYPKVVEVQGKIDKIKKAEGVFKRKLDDCREKLRDLEHELQEKEEILKEIMEQLYGGKINDTKLLEKLKEKEDIIHNQKEIIENAVINIMGEIDIYSREANKYRYQYSLLEENLEKLQVQIEEKIREYDNRLANIHKKIDILRKEMNSEKLKIYDERRKKYENPLVRVENEICEGCNLKLFLNTMNMVLKKELVECEHCGRLLYIE